jgi:hypothetical protein
MRPGDDPTLRLTYALRRPETAEAAAAALRADDTRAATEGLLELLAEPPTACAALAAIEGLQNRHLPVVDDALLDALA